MLTGKNLLRSSLMIIVLFVFGFTGCDNSSEGTLKIRLVVSSGYIKLEDERSFDLKVPSGSESGIKVFPDPPIEVNGGLTTDLILDFDVSRSFIPIPNAETKVDKITGFNFHPVIRVVNNSSVGSISGTVYNNNDTPDNLDDDTAI